MRKIIMIGCGGIAQVLVDIVNNLDYEIIGYTDIVDKGVQCGLPYLGNDENCENMLKTTKFLFFGIGSYLNDFSVKIKLFSHYTALGFEFPPIVPKSTKMSTNVTIGNGTLIRENVIIQSNVNIGNCCSINEDSMIAHDTNIDDFCHIGAKSIIGNSNILGKNIFLGFRVTTVNKIRICSDTLIGACSLVTKDINKPGKYYGIPINKK